MPPAPSGPKISYAPRRAPGLRGIGSDCPLGESGWPTPSYRNDEYPRAENITDGAFDHNPGAPALAAKRGARVGAAPRSGVVSRRASGNRGADSRGVGAPDA